MKMHCHFETFLGERLKNSNSTSSSFRPNEVIKKEIFECIAQTLPSRPVRSDSLTIIVTARKKNHQASYKKGIGKRPFNGNP